MTLLAVKYALLLIAVIIIGLTEISGTRRIHSIVDKLYVHPFSVNRAAQDIGREILLMRHEARDIFLFPQPESIDQSLRNLAGLNADVEKNLNVIEMNFLGDIGRVKDLRRDLAAWNAQLAQVATLARQKKARQAENVFYGTMTLPFNALSADVDYVQEFSRQRAEDYVKEADSVAAANGREARWMLAGMIFLITAVSGFVAYRIAAIIRRQEQLDVMQKAYAEQLLAANNELESFSYSVSHDLRTPLRAIDGYSHILLEDYAGKLDEEGRRLLNVVRDNAQRMGQLIDDILQFSRARRLPMKMTEVDMEELARMALGDVRRSTEVGKLQVEIARLPPARGDRAMLHRVLVNLLSNAIKFSRDNPSPRIAVGGFAQGAEAVYFVRDNGVGFDMQYADKLFGVFQRLHAVNEYKGTGIGLAMVKRIIERHGGRVWAEGRVNEGATIFFALPLEGST